MDYIIMILLLKIVLDYNFKMNLFLPKLTILYQFQLII